MVAAVVAGLLIVVWRLIRHEPLQQVLAGFVGVLISAAVAKYTGRAENYFLPGFLQNLGYGLAFLVSILVRWPLLGIAMGYLTGEGTSWRRDPQLRRVYAAASWIWVGLFFGRLAVQVPLYLAGAIGRPRRRQDRHGRAALHRGGLLHLPAAGAHLPGQAGREGRCRAGRRRGRSRQGAEPSRQA